MEDAGQSNTKGKRLAEKSGTVKVKIGIQSQDGEKVFFRLSCDTKFHKLFMKYWEYKNIEYRTVAFVYDGRWVKSMNTPAQLCIQEGEIVDAMVHQDGGGCSNLEVNDG